MELSQKKQQRQKDRRSIRWGTEVSYSRSSAIVSSAAQGTDRRHLLCARLSSAGNTCQICKKKSMSCSGEIQIITSDQCYYRSISVSVTEMYWMSIAWISCIAIYVWHFQMSYVANYDRSQSYIELLCSERYTHEIVILTWLMEYIRIGEWQKIIHSSPQIVYVYLTRNPVYDIAICKS